MDRSRPKETPKKIQAQNPEPAPFKNKKTPSV